MNELTQRLQQAPFILLYFFLPMVFLVLIRWYTKSESNNYKLPPSPLKLPIIGNLYQLHGLPHHALRSLAQKYGPLMLLYFGHVPTVVVSSAEVARDVMKTYDHVFASRPQLEFSKRLLYGKDLAFAPYGEYWRQMRKVCVLQLLSAKKVQSFRFVREDEVTLLMETIKQLTLSNSVVNLSEMFVSLTNNIICRVALGRKYNEGEGGKKVKNILKELSYLLGVSNMGDLIPWLAWVNNFNGLNARVEKNIKELDSFLNEVLEEHIEKKSRGGVDGDEIEEDFVDVMLGIRKDSTLGIPMESESIKAIVLDMFGGGIDTLSVSLEWCIAELLRHPEIMNEAQNEVRSISKGKFILNEGDMENMVYIKLVIKETLRLHPPVPLLVPRESMGYLHLHGYDIPPKAKILINAYMIGRDPMKWDEPEKFWPCRFLIANNETIDFKEQDFELIPFGSGRRGCPGILFAISTLELTLANLLNTFDWNLPNGMEGKDLDMHESSGLTTRRRNDLIVVGKPHFV